MAYKTACYIYLPILISKHVTFRNSEETEVTFGSAQIMWLAKSRLFRCKKDIALGTLTLKRRVMA
jgi:hypothetical protein